MAIKKEVYSAGPYNNIYAQAVKVGDTLYISGQVGVKHDGTPGADIIEQTQLAYANIKHVLQQYDATSQNIIDETWFATDMKDLMKKSDAVFATRGEFYGGSAEVCQTVVEVSALLMPELMLEIKCVAKL
jgi:enamine deaminase RidA (YjgF/YER057c/UK114 family)